MGRTEMKEVQIRTMENSDYDSALDLWRSSDGIGLNTADGRENIESYLHRNAGLSLAATDGGKLVGAVLCGHDGRRGYLHHLAVAASYRGRGIGRRLVEECARRLAAEKIERCHVFVYPDNMQGLAFWREVGFGHRSDLVICSCDIGLGSDSASTGLAPGKNC